MKLRLLIITVAATLLAVSACAPVGSEAWCKNLEEKPKGDWTANEASDYAANCVF